MASTRKSGNALALASSVRPRPEPPPDSALANPCPYCGAGQGEIHLFDCAGAALARSNDPDFAEVEDAPPGKETGDDGDEWEDLLPFVRGPAGAPADLPDVRVGMTMAGQGTRARLVVVIRREVLAKVATGSNRYRLSVPKGKPDRLRISGAGQEAGSIEARELATGPRSKPGQVSKCVRLSAGYDDRFPNCSIPAAECRYSEENGAIVITLPAWVWDFDERRAAEREATRRSNERAAERRKEPVTGQRPAIAAPAPSGRMVNSTFDRRNWKAPKRGEDGA